jgi:hypothetical protein
MRREVVGQVFPGDSRPVEVKDRVEDFPQVGRGWLSGGPAVDPGLSPCGKDRLDQGPAGSERSEWYAGRGVMPKNYYAGHARHRRLAHPEVPVLVYARRNLGRSAPLNGHRECGRHHTDIPMAAECAQRPPGQERHTWANHA